MCGPIATRHTSCVAHAWKVRGTNSQENPANGRRDTAEKVGCGRRSHVQITQPTATHSLKRHMRIYVSGEKLYQAEEIRQYAYPTLPPILVTPNVLLSCSSRWNEPHWQQLRRWDRKQRDNCWLWTAKREKLRFATNITPWIHVFTSEMYSWYMVLVCYLRFSMRHTKSKQNEQRMKAHVLALVSMHRVCIFTA
jgi:hypothetical protein